MDNVNKALFTEMGLKLEILQALDELNFKIPTPIQAESIPVILGSERDLLGFAQTGTGKTAAFSLPIIEQVNPTKRSVQALILCPTRELCMQITKDIAHFSKFVDGLKSVAIYGGSSMYSQIKKLDDGAQIVVGTPGRVLDLVGRKKLKLDNVQWLVLDEADDMLDKGFKDELDAILEETPENKQTLLFSATMSSWIRKVAQKQMHDPIEIKVAAENQGAETVEHEYVVVHESDRYNALRRLLDKNPDVYGIVFCRTRRETKEVAAKLMEDHYSAQEIHGDISQDQRSEVMARFREGSIKILVATDVAARGIDVNELTHVINYQLPDNPETYVHRSGRTGRAGNEGVSLTILNMREHGKIRRIEGVMRKKFTEITVPTGKEICEAQLMSLVKKVKTTEFDGEKLKPYLEAIYAELDGLSREELIQHFVSVEFARFLDYYSGVKDISAVQGKRPNAKDMSNKRRGNGVKMAGYEINLGKKDGFSVKNLFQMVNKQKSLRGLEIGEIKVGPVSTTFEADQSRGQSILRFLASGKFKGRKILVRKNSL